MNYKFLILLIAGSFLVSGCYTQLETMERERPERSYASQGQVSSNAYDNYYTEEEYQVYEQGYYDGMFDANLNFRSYNHRRSVISANFHWGRPFYGYGHSYSYFNDPFWRYAYHLDPFYYDPFYYSFYGFNSFHFHNRYHRFGYFHRPFSGFGPNFIVIYNNAGAGSSSNIVRGPRSSGVNHGTRVDRTSSGVAARDSRTRVRGGSDTSSHINAQNARIRTGTPVANRGEARTAQTTRTSSGTVDRRRATPPPQRAQPARSRGSNNSGTVNRTRGGSNNSSGTVNRTRGGSNNSSGTVNRTRGGSSSQAAPARSRGSSSQATPSRSRSSSNDSGNRSRNRNND